MNYRRGDYVYDIWGRKVCVEFCLPNNEGYVVIRVNKDNNFTGRFFIYRGKLYNERKNIFERWSNR